MNEYQALLLVKQNRRDAAHAREEAAFRRDAAASQAERNGRRGLSLDWLRAILRQPQLPKVTVARSYAANTSASTNEC